MDPTSDEPNCATLSNELIDFMSCPCLTRIFHISYPSVEMSAAREKGGEKSEGIYQTAENSKPWEKLFLKRSDKPWQQEGEMNYQFLVFVVSASKLTDKPGIYYTSEGATVNSKKSCTEVSFLHVSDCPCRDVFFPLVMICLSLPSQ